jgi:hypothetical protein
MTAPEEVTAHAELSPIDTDVTPLLSPETGTGVVERFDTPGSPS